MLAIESEISGQGIQLPAHVERLESHRCCLRGYGGERCVTRLPQDPPRLQGDLARGMNKSWKTKVVYQRALACLLAHMMNQETEFVVDEAVELEGFPKYIQGSWGRYRPSLAGAPLMEAKSLVEVPGTAERKTLDNHRHRRRRVNLLGIPEIGKRSDRENDGRRRRSDGPRAHGRSTGLPTLVDSRTERPGAPPVDWRLAVAASSRLAFLFLLSAWNWAVLGKGGLRRLIGPLCVTFYRRAPTRSQPIQKHNQHNLVAIKDVRTCILITELGLHKLRKRNA